MGKAIHIRSVILLLTLAAAVSAQTPLACGVDSIEGPTEVEPGMPIRLKAKIIGLNHITKPQFKWWVSAGTITEGQGTDEITIDTAGLGGMTLTATVGLSEVPLGCKVSASITTAVKAFTCGLTFSRFDQYGDLNFEDEKARLDNFAIQLSNEPSSSGYILTSAGQETFENEAAQRLARAKSHLVDVREIDSNRIVTVDCGFTKDLTTNLYIVSAGGPAPQCGDSDVPLSEVKFTKPRPKSSKKKH